MFYVVPVLLEQRRPNLLVLLHSHGAKRFCLVSYICPLLFINVCILLFFVFAIFSFLFCSFLSLLWLNFVKTGLNKNKNTRRHVFPKKKSNILKVNFEIYILLRRDEK